VKRGTCDDTSGKPVLLTKEGKILGGSGKRMGRKKGGDDRDQLERKTALKTAKIQTIIASRGQKETHEERQGGNGRQLALLHS